MTLIEHSRANEAAAHRHSTAEDASPYMRELNAWVAEIEQLAQPDSVVWIDGSRRERHELTQQLVAEGKLIRLNSEYRPGSYLARSEPSDVARVESRTFISSRNESDAGPTNNWVPPEQMKSELLNVFSGSMRGRTMYVVPFSMGPVGGRLSKLGVQITDSAYVVLSMQIMTRAGYTALEKIADGEPWVRAVHSVGAPLVDEYGVRSEDVTWPCNDTKYISHFPETREIWSYGSGYGGNALLGKKSFALRIASVIARDEGWLAEHMLIVKITNPAGRTFHLAAAFPSACGKTNLAMLRSPLPGWTVETIGDDIAWLRQGEDGRLWAINPEAGFFGVAPGTGESTNPNAMGTIWGNTIFTNTALTDDGDVWWEGMTDTPPAHLVDWQGRDWYPGQGRPAAHPNARFTVPADQCPSIADDWEAQDGIPIDAIVFGGRRATNVPLVLEARDWAHGVFLGATVSSEQTAAAEGTVGELRRDPFAMLPFCGYNMADYWAHWLEVGAQLGSKAPKIFNVNWFRKSPEGVYLWPGFGENMRVLQWIAERCAGTADAIDGELGLIPEPADIDTAGLALTDAEFTALLDVDLPAWQHEADLTEAFFDRFGDKVPGVLRGELQKLRNRLSED
ncbi:MAG TPA: phosphoenolpyruvate carboxykinase (GTP) [Gryllotalpicola sp.]